MRTRLKLKPGARGTKKLTQECGDRLICVRYRKERAVYKRAHNAAHKDEIRACQAAYRAAHRAEQRAYYLAHRKEINARKRACRAAQKTSKAGTRSRPVAAK
jgi:hypothetical protein